MVERSPYANVRDPPELQLRHDLVRAKLVRLHTPEPGPIGRYPPSDNSLPARYARAIARNCTSPSFCSANALRRRRRADPGAAGLPLFLGAERRGAAHGRQSAEKPSRRCARRPSFSKGKGPQVQIQLADAMFRSSEDSQIRRRGDPAHERAIMTEKEDATPIASWPRPTIARRWWRRPISRARKLTSSTPTSRGAYLSPSAPRRSLRRLSGMAESRGHSSTQTKATDLSRSATAGRPGDPCEMTSSPLQSLLDGTYLQEGRGAARCRRSCWSARHWPSARTAADALAPSPAGRSGRRLLTSTATAQAEARRGGAAFSDGQRKELEAIIKDYPAQQSRDHAGGAERARSQDGQDPGRAHGGRHQGERRPSSSARRARPSSATPRATCR